MLPISVLIDQTVSLLEHRQRKTERQRDRQTDRHKVKMALEIVICDKVINKVTLFTIYKEQMTRNVPIALTGDSALPTLPDIA